MDAASVSAGKTNDWAYSLPDGVNTSRQQHNRWCIERTRKKPK
jgi:hypothetical protein